MPQAIRPAAAGILSVNPPFGRNRCVVLDLALTCEERRSGRSANRTHESRTDCPDAVRTGDSVRVSAAAANRLPSACRRCSAQVSPWSARARHRCMSRARAKTSCRYSCGGRRPCGAMRDMPLRKMAGAHHEPEARTPDGRRRPPWTDRPRSVRGRRDPSRAGDGIEASRNSPSFRCLRGTGSRVFPSTCAVMLFGHAVDAVGENVDLVRSRHARLVGRPAPGQVSPIRVGEGGAGRFTRGSPRRPAPRRVGRITVNAT